MSWPIGEYDKQCYANSLGLAFSGSSLIGLNLASTISSLTSQLVGTTNSAIPSFQDVSDFAVRITRKYVDARGKLQGRIPPFQGAIFGWCHLDSRYKLLSFGPTSQHEPSVEASAFDLNAPDSVFLMGSMLTKYETGSVHFGNSFSPAQREISCQEI